jgi:8-oxo-dGTP pyrophosphatase MutT (NUDIX family)
MENKNKPGRIFGLGVFVCLFNPEISKMLLIKRNAEKRRKWGYDWGNIGGRIELGETSKQACLREAKEEAGIDLSSSKLIFIKVKETPLFTQDVHAIHFVYASILSEDAKIKLNEESDDYSWFPLDNLPENTIDKKEELIEIAALISKLGK